MNRPPLSIVLSSVLAAAIEGAGRPGLLAALHPDFGRPVIRQDVPDVPGLAQVITLPRVIPMPRRAAHPLANHPEQLTDDPNPDPDPHAA
ncbi:MAG TPA: hypothetical protein VLL08_26600 [Kineosporiaceae bacterium]|nr:hypothetical protein [Kineosporiaceae bacterium]